MALNTFILLSLFTVYVAGDSCVTYDFEENFDSLFSNHGTCQTIPSLWVTGEYSDLELASPNENSTKFIRPPLHNGVGCVASFFLTMHSGGVFEFNIYVETAAIGDHIQIMTFSDVPGGIDGITGIFFANFNTGWHTARITVTGPDSYRGYVALFGVASPNATILVDSFRYTPPGADGSPCQIYG